MRWLYGADGPGAAYCRQCEAVRRSSTRCEECPEPALLEENVAAVRLYLATLTQWRTSPTGEPTGLDYAAAETVARLTGVTLAGEVFDGLQLLEAETLRCRADGRRNAH